MWAGGLRPGQAFDAARVEPALAKLCAGGSLPPRGRALVPGCGRGYAVAELARAGFDATGLEIAPTAVKAANDHISASEQLGDAAWRVIAGDFFEHRVAETERYSLIYDCTFLCAIEARQREAWAQQMAALVQPGGECITLIFPVQDPPYAGGPPFCMSVELVRSLLLPAGFEEKSVIEVATADLARASVKSGAKEFLGRWTRISK